MIVSKKHSYAPSLLTAAVILTAAVWAYPHDAAISSALQSFARQAGKFSAIRELLELFRPFGQGDVIVVIAVGIGLCGSRRRALHILLALAVMSALIWPVKMAVGRERPAFKNTQSFPSGDAATAAAFVTPLAGQSPWMTSAAVLVTGGVAAERTYYGRHYPTDVAAGACFGILASAIAMALLRRWRRCPDRRWFAIAGILIVSVLSVTALRAHGAPYLFSVLRIWGPLGGLLALARLMPVWTRRRRIVASSARPAPATGGFLFSAVLAITAGGGCALVCVPWLMPFFGVRIPLVAMGLIALVMARTLWTSRRRNRPEVITPMAVAGAVCIILTIGLSLLPAIHACKANLLTF